MKIPAQKTAKAKLNVSAEEFMKTAAQTGSQLRWDLKSINEQKLTMGVPFSFWSWGERFTIKVEGDTVHFHSRCSLPTAIIDWGKNRQNMEKLIGSLPKEAFSDFAYIN